MIDWAHPNYPDITRAEWANMKQKPVAQECKCGAAANVRWCYSTSTGHGYTIRCKNEHPGPWAATVNGAIRLWNQLQKSSLTIEQAEQAMGIGFSVKDAIRIYAR